MKSLIVANWKMNPGTFREAKRLLEATKKAAERILGVLVVVAPPALYLRELRHITRGKKVTFAAQHAHAEVGGPYTGEISMREVKDARATHVLIGHAERRSLGESNDDTRRKVISALALKLTPILCVGEERRAASADHFSFIREQLRAGFADVMPTKVGKVIVAYEPVWAIGAQSAMSARDMHEMSIFIRKTIVEMHGEGGHSVTILYGGAIEENNAAHMLKGGDVKGLLVGRASEDPARISALLQAISGKK